MLLCKIGGGRILMVGAHQYNGGDLIRRSCGFAKCACARGGGATRQAPAAGTQY